MFQNPIIEAVRGKFEIGKIKDGNVQLMVTVPCSEVDLNELAIISGNSILFSAESAQGKLDYSERDDSSTKVATGQMNLLDGGQQEPAAPGLYSVMLVEFTKVEKHVKEAENLLKKEMAIKGVADLRMELQSLATGPIGIVHHVNEVDAVGIKIRLEELGCVCSLVPWKEIFPEETTVAPVHLYQVIIKAMPADDFGIKAAEKWLQKSIPDYTIEEIRGELQSLPWTIMDQLEILEANDTKAELLKLGCEVDLAECPMEEVQGMTAVVEQSLEENQGGTEPQEEGESFEESEEGTIEGGSDEMGEGLQEAE